MLFKRLLFILVLFFGIFNLALAQPAVDKPESPGNQGKESSNQGNAGITLGGECLNGVGKGCFIYEEIVNIGNENKKYTVLSIIQDVIYAAGYMVGTVLAAVIIWCGLGYIIASRGGKDTNAYRRGLTNGAIGAILVLGAYAIIRIIQYIARG